MVPSLAIVLGGLGMSNRDVEVCLECAVITRDQAKEHVKQNRTKIYIGGTALMWWRLRHDIQYSFDFYGSQTDEYKIKALGNHIIKDKNSYMVFEKRLRGGNKIIALYGSSPQTTEQAVKLWRSLPYTRADYRLIIKNRSHSTLLHLEY